jgi:hypothetical protein
MTDSARHDRRSQPDAGAWPTGSPDRLASARPGHDRTFLRCLQTRVSAETACEIFHKAFPRKRPEGISALPRP